MGGPLKLTDINNAGFSTSLEAHDLSEEFKKRLGFSSRNYAARLAIARSLSLSEPPPSPDGSELGKTIRGNILFGTEDVPVWVALILEHEQLNDATVSDIQDRVRRHWHRGALLLERDWEQAGRNYDRFLVHLAAQAGITGEGYQGKRRAPTTGAERFVPKAVPVSVTLGEVSRDLSSKETISWTLNGPGRSPHVAVMGTLGTGKTRTAMSMVKQVHRQSGCPIIVFDMGKGDLAADTELATELGAEVIDITRMAVPLDVLHVPPDDPKGVVNVAMRFRESFARVPSNRLGGAQVDALREAAQRALDSVRPTRIVDVRDRLREVYAEKRRKDDVATSTFNDLTQWNLFEPRFSPEEFFSRSWIIDVHAAPETAQRLVVFLVLDALYTFLTLQKDTEVDAQGHRAMRCVLAIDEARKVLGYEQASLVGLFRESRSKGGSVFLMSQSPDDFDGEKEDFLENIGLGACFRTNARSKGLQALLGQQVDLAGLPDGVCVTRLVDRGLTRVQAWEAPAGVAPERRYGT